jgi:hypothetical protein
MCGFLIPSCGVLILTMAGCKVECTAPLWALAAMRLSTNWRSSQMCGQILSFSINSLDSYVTVQRQKIQINGQHIFTHPHLYTQLQNHHKTRQNGQMYQKQRNNMWNTPLVSASVLPGSVHRRSGGGGRSGLKSRRRRLKTYEDSGEETPNHTCRWGPLAAGDLLVGCSPRLASSYRAQTSLREEEGEERNPVSIT